MKKKFKKLIIVLLALCIAVLALSAWIYSTIPSPDIFEKLVTTDLINYGCMNIVPHSITCYKSTFQLEYRIDFKLDTTESELFSMIIIKVQPAWFISPGDGVVLGPGGGGDWTTITTCDRKYDITVEQHNKGMDGVISPNISTDKLSRKLNRLYSNIEKSDKESK